MAWQYITGNWPLHKELLRQQWQQLTPADLDRIAGDRERLLDCLQRRYGCERTAADHRVAAWETYLADRALSGDAADLSGEQRH